MNAPYSRSRSRAQLVILAGLILAVVSSLPAAVVYDFVQKAPEAKWSRSLSAPGELPWNGRDNDARGFARHLTNAVLEDGKSYGLVLQTHPEWKSEGSIFGTYANVQVPAGAKFAARVGFLKNATATDGVTFAVQIIDQSTGATQQLVIQAARYDGVLDGLTADLAPYAGKTVSFRIGLRAGATARQDWAVWASAAITQELAIQTMKVAAVKPVMTAKVAAPPASRPMVQAFKPAVIKRVTLMPMGTVPPKHKIEDAGTLSVEEPLTVLDRIWKDNERANTYYYLPREINLIRDPASGNYRVSAVWTQDQKIRTTLALQANIDPADVKILDEALKKAKGPQASLRSMPYDEANIIDMKGWEDWQIENIRIPTFGSLEGELPVNISMTPETLAQLKPLLEREGLTAGMRLKTGDVEREVPIKVGLKYATGRMYSDLGDLGYSYKRSESLLTLHNVRNLSAFPLKINSVSFRFRLPNGDELYKDLKPQADAVLPAHGTGSVTVRLTPQPLLAAELARSLPASKSADKPVNPLLKQALDKLKGEVAEKAGIDIPEKGEGLDPKVDEFFRSRARSYWMEVVPDFECQECLDAVWEKIEVVSYIERMRKINVEALANVFDPSAYESPIEVEKVHIEIRSPYLSAQAKDGLMAAVDLNKDKLREDVVVYLPRSSGETLTFDYKIKVILKTGQSAESEAWETVSDSLDLTLGTFHVAKVFERTD